LYGSRIRQLLALVAAVASAFVLAACAATEPERAQVDEGVSAAKDNGQGADDTQSEEPTPEATPRQRQKAQPDAEFTSSCDMLMPDDVLSGNYSLVGSAKVRNTGNVGIVVKVSARWDQVASDDIRDSKSVRVPRGKSRSVKFRVPATQSQISEFQESPDYFNNGACKINVRVTDTFGKAPLED
jgi:hypothetical protein